MIGQGMGCGGVKAVKMLKNKLQKFIKRYFVLTCSLSSIYNCMYQGGKSRDFCLDALYGSSNTLYGHSDRMQVDFSMFSHLYPESYTPFSSPHFPLSNTTRIASLSFLL